MNTKTITLLSLTAVALTAVFTCTKRTAWSDDEAFFNEKRRALPPAADSAEWLKRFADGPPLRQAYPELPAQTEWPTIMHAIRQSGTDEDSIKKRVFGEVLADDRAAAEKSIRALLVKKSDLTDAYSRNEALKYLYSFSADPEETKRWVEKSLPQEKPDSGSSPNGSEDFEAMLADNRIDEAVSSLRAKVDTEEDAGDKIELLAKIAEVAKLTDRLPLYDKTVGEMTSIALSMPVEDFYGPYSFLELFQELAYRNDWQTIRKLATRFFPKDKADAGYDDFCQTIFLPTAYHLDGPAAFLTELRRLPERGVASSKAYASLLMDDMLGDGTRIDEMVIRSFMAAGETGNARDTLAYMLALDMGNDTLYGLAIEYYPEQAESMFEALRAYNPYEERPLIWLAEIALNRKDPAKARELVDQAIALDPSDGDHGKLTRMQVYDVLSRVLLAEGDSEKSAFFSEVLKAIRLGEVADDYLHAGLIQEATRRYQEALGHFQDAYCLQSRLAKTLLKAGREEEAMKHFEKAFELMPVSFGPMESDCFGCEKIFQDERVRGIAVTTFNRIIASTPENPRTFYLLGIVLEEMKMQKEAVAAFSKALEIDPKYYNCANRLLTLLSRDPATVKDVAAVQKQLAGMAPYQDLQEIYHARTDLRQLWQDAQSPPVSPLKLQPLPLPFKLGKEDNSEDYYYLGSRIDALDGWTTQELLKDNSFLYWLDYF